MAQAIAAPPKERYIPNALKFAFGGLAGMAATCVVQPLDLIKTRMQLSGGSKTSFTVAGEIVAREGFFAVYTGLSAGLLRQATYTTTRLGVYNYLFDAYKERNAGAAPGFGTKTLLGVAAGSIGAFVGTPAEVALIRMTADGRLPVEQRRNYKNVADALLRIIKEEGVLKLWRGATPTVGRAMVVNAAQLSTYSQTMVYTDDRKPAKHKIPRAQKTLIGGLCGMMATVIVHPLDLVKVRMQVYPNAKTTREMAKRIIRCEGIPALYSGLTAGLMRQATYTTTRLGVYYWLYEEYRNKYGKIPTLPEKLMIGAYAGLAGAFAGNPSEVILVRMMADGKRDPCSVPACARNPRYRGVIDAIYKISCREGVCALWRGGTLTLTRSVFVSVAQIGTYVEAREVLIKRKLAEGTALHLYTSVISSFFTACLTLPVDLIKTRYQFRREGKSMTQTEVLEDILRNNGVRYLWKGFLPYFIRLSLHTSLTLLIVEEFSAVYSSHRLIPKK